MSLSSSSSRSSFVTPSLSLIRLFSFAPSLLLLLSLPLSAHAGSSPQEKVLKKDGSTADEGRGWAPFEQIPVQCLNRSIDTGEHVTQENGELQYIPFWTCNETGRPLELPFGSEKDVNCTIAEVDDAFFHILEFYVHNDAPLSCRVPSLPPSQSSGKPGGPAVEYTHLQIALTGTLQRSHLHINPQLNMLLHTTETGSTGKDKTAASSAAEEAEAKKKKKKVPPSAAVKGKNSKYLAVAEEGQIIASTAYSLPPTANSPRLVIGDPLPLTFRVRWYSTAVLPPSTSRIGPPRAGLGGHVHLSTAAYCVLSFGAGLAVSIAYFRGVDMPRRLRRYGAEKLGGGGEGRGGAGGGGYGYAYVPGGFPGGGGGGGGGGFYSGGKRE